MNDQETITISNTGMRIAERVLAVSFSSMSNAINAADAVGISNFVNHTIVADAYPPVVFAPANLSASWRSGIARKRVHGANDSIVN